MTPERRARIMQLIAEAEDSRELAGLLWGFEQQGEATAEVHAAIAKRMDEECETTQTRSSAAPKHSTGRRQSLQTWAFVATSSTMH